METQRERSIGIRKIGDTVHTQIAEFSNLASEMNTSVLSHHWSILAQIKRRPINSNIS